jgi:hypothetical protein
MHRCLALTLLLAPIASCAGGRCGFVIEDSVSLRIHLPISPDQLTSATVTVCQNQTCAIGAFDAVVLSGTAIDLTGPNRAWSGLGSANASSEAGGTLVEIAVIGGGPYVDGDRWTVTIAGQAASFDAGQTVRYTTHDQACNNGGTYTQLSLEMN